MGFGFLPEGADLTDVPAVWRGTMSRIRKWWEKPLREKVGLKPKPVEPADREAVYDEIIMRASQATGVPWFLLKGLIWQESRFNPNAESPAGAKGLTQLMPGTAADLGVDDPFDPEQAIFGGAKYLAALFAQFKKESGITRWRFALGAYNCGAGYIYQAQRNVLAAGMDATSWPIVAANLATAKVRGKTPHWQETVVYVEKVSDRAYDYYVDAVRKVS